MGLAIFAELGDKAAMAAVYKTLKEGFLVKTPPDTFRAVKQMQKSMAIFEEMGDKSKAAACMHFRGDASVMETMMTMFLDAGMYYEAVKIGKERCTTFHNGGDMQGEGMALVKLGSVMMENEAHEKASKIAEAALGIFAGINDMAGLKSAKDLLDGAKHARVVEEINVALNKASEYMHIPSTLVVDPGLNKRIQDAYSTAMQG